MFIPDFRRCISKAVVVASLALGVLLVAGCGNMRVQPKLAKPFMESPEFGVAARDILPEAVAVGQLNEDELFYNGTIDGELADVFPFPVTADVIARGQSKFNAFCTPCHGYGGYGDGVIYEEGFPTPASYHDPVIREKPVGHYYQVISYGFNNMYNYANRVQPEDRWAIVAYIRTLQLSQNAELDQLPPEIQSELAVTDRELAETEAYGVNTSK